jgi:hypothetical protein
MEKTGNIVDEELKDALGEIRYVEGLLMGLFLGILGNLCVSFLIETIHAFGTIFFYGWLAVFFGSLAITAIVTLVLIRRIIKRIVRTFTAIFPSLEPKQNQTHREKK